MPRRKRDIEWGAGLSLRLPRVVLYMVLNDAAKVGLWYSLVGVVVSSSLEALFYLACSPGTSSAASTELLIDLRVINHLC